MKIDFQTLLIPLTSSLVGLVPFLINLMVNTLEKRSQNTRINGILHQVNSRVGFLTNWYALQKEVSDPAQLNQIKKIMSEELNETYELFIDITLEPDEETKQRKTAMARYRSTNKMKRFFLLYTPYNARGWLFHTLYYMCALPLIAVVIYMVYGQIVYNDYLYGIPQENLIIAAVTVLFLLIFRSLGRNAARGIEERMGAFDRKTNPFRIEN